MSSEKFTVVQKALNWSIPRDLLQHLTHGISGLTSYDGAMLHRRLHGFVAEHLTREAAHTLQQRLIAHGYEAEVVASEHIPRLMAPMHCQRLFIETSGLRAATSAGRVYSMAKDEISLLGGGRFQRRAPLPSPVRSLDPFTSVPSESDTWRRPSTQLNDSNEPEFVLELFQWKEPFRIRFLLQHAIPIFVNEQALSLRRPADLASAIARLAHALPTLHISVGLQHIGDPRFTYVSQGALEEELRWHLLFAFREHHAR
ncbi:MAG: hypothetical protein ACFCU3_03050 [Verrucomicrobiales bacterium]